MVHVIAANANALAVRCLVCGEGITERLVKCKRCETPHHEDCFTYAGGCAVYACGSDVSSTSKSSSFNSNFGKPSIVPERVQSQDRYLETSNFSNRTMFCIAALIFGPPALMIVGTLLAGYLNMNLNILYSFCGGVTGSIFVLNFISSSS